MARVQVWAFRPIAELQFETGRVECDEELATRLIAEGKAQDLNVGAVYLKDIEPRTDAPADPPSDAPPDRQTYQTTQVDQDEAHTVDLTPAKGRRRR